MTDLYARIMARPPTGTCDICKTRPAAAWFGQSSVAHCATKECIDACFQQQMDMIARIEAEEREQEQDIP